MVLVLGGLAGVVLLVSGQGVRRNLHGAWWLGISPWLTAAGMLACLSGFMVPTLDVRLNGVDVAAVLHVMAAVATPMMTLIGWRRYQQAI